MSLLPRIIPPDERVTIEPWSHTQAAPDGDPTQVTINVHGLKIGDTVTAHIRSSSGAGRRYKPFTCDGHINGHGLTMHVQMVEDL